MGKLRTLSGREVCRLLAERGSIEVRRRGGHVVMQKQSPAGTTTVVVPDHRSIRIGTLLSIIRQSQLSGSVFETL